MPRPSVPTLLLTLLLPLSLAAQGGGPATAPATFAISPEYRAVQRSALESRRTLLLAMADSMPEALYRDRATPAQRDFAQQLHHVVVAESMVASRWFLGQPRPEAMGDTAAVLNSRAAMKDYINREYDFAAKVLGETPDAERNVRVEFFGVTIPRWQVWDELHQHAIWTLGQVVANFRRHGMAPPAYTYF